MRKPTYYYQKKIEGLTYKSDAIDFCEFESCIFIGCNFSECSFTAVTFIDCQFVDCNLNATKVNHTAFRGVEFKNCQISDVNFAMSDKLIFEIRFANCILDFSKFYALKMKGTTFTGCSLIAADFMETDLTEVLFDGCDLYRTVFMKSILLKADFSSSFNYTIDPEINKIKQAIFSREGVKGLLQKYEIQFVS